MSAHTPGPWVIKFRNDHSAYISLGHPNGEHKQFDIAFDSRYPSDVADARLIASAPALLEALERLSALCERTRLPEWKMTDAERNALAVIAAAKGEA